MKNVKQRAFINELHDLIGMECTYNFNPELHEDCETWSDENTVKCKIVGYQIEIEDKPFYNIYFNFMLIPLEDHPNLDEDDIIYMQMGVSHKLIMFDIF